MTKALALALQLLRVGLVRSLLLLDGFLVVLIVVDYKRFSGTWYFWAAARHSVANTSDLAPAFFNAITLLLGLPLILTATRLALSRKSRHHGNLARELSTPLLIAHVVVTFMICLFSLCVPSMSTLSGYGTLNETSDYAFRAYFGIVNQASVTYASWLWFSLVFIAFPILFTYITRKTHPPDFVREIYSRLCLLDLPSGLYPVGYSPRKANFVAGAVSPAIELIQERAELRIRRYNSASPGSTRAIPELEGIARECRDNIKRILLRSQDATSRFVSFTTSTTRALELAISLRSGEQLVLLSPFEHPVERRVVKWLERQGRAKEIGATYAPSLYMRPPAAIVDDISLALAEALEKHSSDRDRAVLLLSEVCWLTGVRIPVRAVIATLNNLLGWLPAIVVDGAHAVANNSAELPDLKGIDTYVFSGHKWLFSGTPIGVMIQDRPLRGPSPLDVWQEDETGSIRFSVATSMPNAFCGLASALEVFEQYREALVFRRSRELRNRLWAAASSRFGFLGVDDEASLEGHSFIVGLIPHSGRFTEIPTEPDLVRFFDKRGVSVNVGRAHRDIPATIRVTLPFFQNMRDVDMLVDVLDQL